jgi:hypothetical protein
LDFDGLGAGYVNFGLYEVQLTNATVAGWFYADANAGASRIIDSNYTVGLYLGLNGDGVGGAFVANASPYGSYMPYVPGQWNHVAVTRVGAVNTCFVNGRKTTATYTNSSAGTGTGASLYLGRDTNNNGNSYWDGRIDDVRIYKRALTDEEIRLLSTGRGIAFEPRTSRRRPLVLMAEQIGDDPSSQSSASSASSVSSLSSSSSSISTSSSSQSSISTSSSSGAPVVATGYQQVAATATVKTVAAFNLPWWASHAELQATDQDIRYTLDGLTDPTQTSGFVLEARAKPEAFNMDDFIRIKFVRGAASNAQLNVHFIPRGEP